MVGAAQKQLSSAYYFEGSLHFFYWRRHKIHDCKRRIKNLLQQIHVEESDAVGRWRQNRLWGFGETWLSHHLPHGKWTKSEGKKRTGSKAKLFSRSEKVTSPFSPRRTHPVDSPLPFPVRLRIILSNVIDDVNISWSIVVCLNSSQKPSPKQFKPLFA